jgi:nucleoside-diphosphate-sugar epimerase
MTIDLHLLGGSGRIGTALVEAFISNPLKEIRGITIYCDSTKASRLGHKYSEQAQPRIDFKGYSAFHRDTLRESGNLPTSAQHRHVVINLRGINNKQQWLNQPLDALELQANSCRTLINADLWMQPGVEIIHLSSLLCDLIEGSRSLDEICEGQESYRRPYMVSRLHQETMLSANAFQHSISTCFLRLPAVYGFPDDIHSPWVLNSLCNQRRRSIPVQPRNPRHFIYLTHKEPLLAFLRALVTGGNDVIKDRTVSYLRPPMLCMPASSLASLVQGHSQDPADLNIDDLDIKLVGDTSLVDSSLFSHLRLLLSFVQSLLNDD